MKICTYNLIFCLLFLRAYSQAPTINPGDFSKMADVLPPSANAASIGKYGGLNMNLSTGTLNFEIPLYDLSSTNLKLPISISYATAGIKVDEVGGIIGMSWILNAGGVITRTVLGAQDELLPRENHMPSPTNYANYATFIDDLAEGRADGQPDLYTFTFNGKSGKFILDSLGNPFLLTYSNFKIEQNGTSFKITDGEGVQYIFGSTDFESFAVERSDQFSGGAGCSVKYPDNIPTSFFLTSIIHPNKDTITLSYTTTTARYISGYSEFMASFDPVHRSDIAACNVNGPGGASAPPMPPQLTNTSCPSYYETTIAILHEIKSTSGSRVQFLYVGRKDMADSLLTRIDIFQPNNQRPFKSFSFNYLSSKASIDFANGPNSVDSTLWFRDFLSSLSENDSAGIAIKTHSFTYNDLAGLPVRLSFAQDDYGFFNGRNHNFSLIPTPTDASFQNALPTAQADRSPDTAYSFKGLLTEITYPTGGFDSICYEGNSFPVRQINYPPVSQDGVNVNNTVGSGESENTDTTSFSVQFKQTVTFRSTVSLLPNAPDAGDNYGQMTLTDLTTNTVIFEDFMTLANNPSSIEVDTVYPGHTYLMTVLAGGVGVSTGSNFEVMFGDTTSSIVDKIFYGGARVGKVISSAEFGSAPTIKRYFYATQVSPTGVESGPSIPSFLYTPIYEKYLSVPAFCGEGEPACLYSTYWYYTMYSNPTVSLYLYSAIPVSYATVWESNGENFESGGVQHEFLIDPDNASFPYAGQTMLGAPMTSFAWRNGREIHKQTFKKINDGFVPIQDVYTHYNEDVRKNLITNAYIADLKAIPDCAITSPTANIALELSAYQIYQYWVYPDTVTTITYDQAGSGSLRDTIVVAYDNVAHAMPTSITSDLSNGTEQIIHKSYPQDLTLTGDAETARQALINSHIISPVLQQQVSKGGVQTIAETTNYNIFPSGVILPHDYILQLGQRAAEKRVEFMAYNKFGKLTEQSKEADAIHSYVWDYNSLYPIAEAANADSASIAYTSFEADGSGNWTIGTGNVDAMNSITGRNSYNLTSGTITKSGLNSSTTYIVSYWSQNGSYSIPGTISGYPVTGKTISFHSPGWTLYVHKVTGQTTITLSGTGHIDELRLYPATAQMTTYTYDPLVGMTSRTDVGNRATYFEYDGLQRLKRIRDQDYNILKSLEYQYQVSTGCGGNCFSIPMQTLAGTTTLSYPVGVFNIHGKLLGNAPTPVVYTNVWNSDTADSRLGGLAVGTDSLHFKITLNAGQTLPASVTGCRYYQVDLAWNQLDGVRNINAAYVDFGDGTSMRLGKTPLDTTGLTMAPRTALLFDPGADGISDTNFYIQYGPYYIHTYLDTSVKTVTFYHNDGTETPAFDSWNYGAGTLSRITNFKGNFPQHMTFLGGTSYQQPGASSVANVTNWNTIRSITEWFPYGGYWGEYLDPWRHMGYVQDFLAADTNLTTIRTGNGSYYTQGYWDSTFKLSRMKSNWTTYFTKLNAIAICEDQWNHEDLSVIPNLVYFNLIAGTQNHSNNPSGNSVVDIDPAEIDTIFNQIDAGSGQHISGGTIIIQSAGTGHTSASNTAVHDLLAKGWTLTINSTAVTN